MIKSITKEIKLLEQKKLEAINKLEEVILNLPENENIKMLSDKPVCYIIKASELLKPHTHSKLYGNCNNFSPKFHYFKTQYKIIISWLRRIDFKDITRLWELSKENNKLMLSSTQVFTNHKVNLHPQVIKNVDSVLSN